MKNTIPMPLLITVTLWLAGCATDVRVSRAVAVRK